MVYFGTAAGSSSLKTLAFAHVSAAPRSSGPPAYDAASRNLLRLSAHCELVAPVPSTLRSWLL